MIARFLFLSIAKVGGDTVEPDWLYCGLIVLRIGLLFDLGKCCRFPPHMELMVSERVRKSTIIFVIQVQTKKSLRLRFTSVYWRTDF